MTAQQFPGKVHRSAWDISARLASSVWATGTGLVAKGNDHGNSDYVTPYGASRPLVNEGYSDPPSPNPFICPLPPLRTNVWDYAGVNTFGATRNGDLAMHPTVKPVALVGDAIRDCSRRDDLVLDMFGGSGSTLIAADLAGRRARLVEYDPLYCDVIVRRWEKLSGKRAQHLPGGLETR